MIMEQKGPKNPFEGVKRLPPPLLLHGRPRCSLQRLRGCCGEGGQSSRGHLGKGDDDDHRFPRCQSFALSC